MAAAATVNHFGFRKTTLLIFLLLLGLPFSVSSGGLLSSHSFCECNQCPLLAPFPAYPPRGWNSSVPVNCFLSTVTELHTHLASTSTEFRDERGRRTAFEEPDRCLGSPACARHRFHGSHGILGPLELPVQWGKPTHSEQTNQPVQDRQMAVRATMVAERRERHALGWDLGNALHGEGRGEGEGESCTATEEAGEPTLPQLPPPDLGKPHACSAGLSSVRWAPYSVCPVVSSSSPPRACVSHFSNSTGSVGIL